MLYCNILWNLVHYHYIPYERTTMDHNDIYAIYHKHIITNTNYYCNLTQISTQHKIPILYA